ncbi:MAG: DUF2807 domain-containing protein [Saprospiraceae bacterium]|nr:MAG: DUF2807 domain-containing protein [Saprospiraceae bacterium]
MNKLKWIFLTTLLTSMTMSSCFIDVNDDNGFFNCEDGDGPMVNATLDVTGFRGVDLDIPIKVFITQGPDFDVVVEGKQNIIDELELDVSNGVWDIKTDHCVRDIGDMKIFITMPEVDFLGISGSGSIVSTGVLLVDDIELKISGSGELDVEVEADDIDGRVSGSGTMRLFGFADQLDYRVSGSGDLKAFDLEVRKADIQISGSGDAEVFVTELLEVRISGSGDVIYLGNPTIDASISGSGEVRPG